MVRRSQLWRYVAGSSRIETARGARHPCDFLLLRLILPNFPRRWRGGIRAHPRIVR